MIALRQISLAKKLKIQKIGVATDEKEKHQFMFSCPPFPFSCTYETLKVELLQQVLLT